MLFKNLRSGNIVDARNKTSIDLMLRSSIYEAVECAAPVDMPDDVVPDVVPAQAGKRRKKAPDTAPDTSADAPANPDTEKQDD